MKDKAALRNRFIESITRLANRYAVLAKMPVDFGTGERITAAEIHSITAIGSNDGITVSALSDLFGITRGAVSQMIGKLERRGYITKSRQPDSWKEVVLSLTDKGKKAFAGHEAFHRDMDSGILGELDAVGDEQIESYLEIMKKIEAQIEKYISRLS